MKCRFCGFEGNRDTGLFCAQCGKPLVDASSTGRLADGTVLQGRYRVVRTLGTGGMGAVYLVEDQALYGKQWALKEVVISSSEAFADALKQFRQEAKILVGLSHPNLPQVVAVFSETGREYLVMEYVEGETLEENLQKHPNGIPKETVLKWAEALCDVLSYLHSRTPPIIFRDIKPGNIMVTRDGWIKLVDFGIARIFDPAKSRDTIEMGTVGYAPPEQYGKGQTDARSDIYALGATLHHLLTGRDPGEQPFVFPPLEQYGVQVPSNVAQAIEQSVAYDPDKRPRTTGELKQALLEELAPAAKPKKPTKPRAKRNLRWLIPVVAGLALIAVVATAAVAVDWDNALSSFRRATATFTPTREATLAPTSTEAPVVVTPGDTPTRRPTSAPKETLAATPTPTWTPSVSPTFEPTATEGGDTETPTVTATQTPAATNTRAPTRAATATTAPTQAPTQPPPTQPPPTQPPPTQPPPTQPPPTQPPPTQPPPTQPPPTQPPPTQPPPPTDPPPPPP